MTVDPAQTLRGALAGALAAGAWAAQSPRSRIARAVAIASWSAPPRRIGNAPSAASSQETTGWNRNSSSLATK